MRSARRYIPRGRPIWGMSHNQNGGGTPRFVRFNLAQTQIKLHETRGVLVVGVDADVFRLDCIRMLLHFEKNPLYFIRVIATRQNRTKN